MEYILTLTFLTETGTKSSLTINGVKDSITQDEANSLMDTIITNDIFTSKGGSFVGKSEAKLTERKITKYEI
ncbi:DUF2922 domain-containing protein [uncultured Clostridium sp.]|uniref:DUF2922 domain-containing protein n=1 Tax=uncultured Clostridium sp. TaxID=59620 RepID=UPI0025D0794C|nr:DUF2922 domain-containing protein [uncultured Clostridium sp.]